MQTEEILKAIDEQIAHLQKVRGLLAGIATKPQTGKRGRPKGSVSKADIQTALTAVKTSGRKSKMSAEGRARIAKAQKARWAAQKSTATTSVAKGKTGLKRGRKPSTKGTSLQPVEQAPPPDEQR